jgi:capsular polysaccharide transport system permease protein
MSEAPILGPLARRKGELQPSEDIRHIYQRLSVKPSRILITERQQQSVRRSDAARVIRWVGFVWFFISVVAPIATASIYYSLIASNQYVAEFRFTVTDASMLNVAGTNPLLSVLGGVSGGANNNFLVVDYLSSRQAVEELQKRINVEKLYSKSSIDWWSRFDSSKPLESFVRYWHRRITARYDLVTGIATAEVRAFDPADALLIANTLVDLSEELINRIAMRTKVDTVHLARAELEKAQDRLKTARANMTSYRDKFGLIDPNSSVVASNSSLIQTLRANLAQLETQLTTLQAQRLNSDAPAVVTLKNQIKSTQEQLARTEASVGHQTNNTALSTVVGDFERLNMEVQFAQSLVTSAMQAYEQARASAASQQLYITPYVRPSLPESSTYPARVWSVIFVTFLALAVWFIGLLIGRSTFERFA